MKYKLIYWWIHQRQWDISSASYKDGFDINKAHETLAWVQRGRKDVFYRVVEYHTDYKILPPPPKEVLDALPKY